MLLLLVPWVPGWWWLCGWALTVQNNKNKCMSCYHRLLTFCATHSGRKKTNNRVQKATLSFILGKSYSTFEQALTEIKIDALKERRKTIIIFVQNEDCNRQNDKLVCSTLWSYHCLTNKKWWFPPRRLHVIMKICVSCKRRHSWHVSNTVFVICWYILFQKCWRCLVTCGSRHKIKKKNLQSFFLLSFESITSFLKVV